MYILDRLEIVFTISGDILYIIDSHFQVKSSSESYGCGGRANFLIEVRNASKFGTVVIILLIYGITSCILDDTIVIENDYSLFGCNKTLKKQYV